MDVGERIKKYREKQNLSQDELALKIFVSRQTISNWETNKSYPDIKSLIMLSNIFNVSLDDFVKGDIEKMRKSVTQEEIKKFNKLGTIFTLELIVLVISAYPLFKLTKYIGVIIWGIVFGITFITAHKIEKMKKNNDIQTYKEIISFIDGKPLTHDEGEQERGKRIYQKIFAAILSGIITLIVCIIVTIIIKNL